MPSSFASAFAPIVGLLIGAAPKRVIDIGPGWGKYGLACREYLPELEALDAIEVLPGRRATQDAIYDTVHTVDARQADDPMFVGHDIALLIDVIEHMTIAEGTNLLRTVQRVGCNIIVSTPKVFAEQHDELNPFERHVSLWSWGDFAPFNIKTDVSTIDSIIFLLGH